MFELSTISLADLLGLLTPFTRAVLALSALLILWEVGIVLGALIGTLREGNRRSLNGTVNLRPVPSDLLDENEINELPRLPIPSRSHQPRRMAGLSFLPEFPRR